jgi:hypothetical protein
MDRHRSSAGLGTYALHFERGLKPRSISGYTQNSATLGFAPNAGHFGLCPTHATSVFEWGELG